MFSQLGLDGETGLGLQDDAGLLFTESVNAGGMSYGCCMGSFRCLRLNYHCNGWTGDVGNLIGWEL